MADLPRCKDTVAAKLPSPHDENTRITSPTAKPDDLLAIASSYDSTGRYGGQTPFSDQLADHWVASEFQVDSTHNSLMAVMNEEKPADALITFHYNHGQSHYEIAKPSHPAITSVEPRRLDSEPGS